MASFVRFVFTILIVGMLVNLAVVLLANAHSQRVQATQYAQQANGFAAMVAEVDGHARRADIVVEEQRIDARNMVKETTLLLRQYQALGSHQERKLPVVRIVIPGDRLLARGVVLNFDAEFSGPQSEYKMLAGHRLCLFDLFCGEGETAPANAQAEDPRFTFFPRDKVPELLRLDPLLPQPSYFELKLWQFLWSQVPETPRDVKLPWTTPGAGHVKATWLAPDVKTVRRGHTYTAFVDGNSISLSEDEASSIDLVQTMTQDIDRQAQPQQ